MLPDMCLLLLIKWMCGVCVCIELQSHTGQALRLFLHQQPLPCCSTTHLVALLLCHVGVLEVVLDTVISQDLCVCR